MADVDDKNDADFNLGAETLERLLAGGSLNPKTKVLCVRTNGVETPTISRQSLTALLNRKNGQFHDVLHHYGFFKNEGDLVEYFGDGHTNDSDLWNQKIFIGDAAKGPARDILHDRGYFKIPVEEINQDERPFTAESKREIDPLIQYLTKENLLVDGVPVANDEDSTKNGVCLVNQEGTWIKTDWKMFWNQLPKAPVVPVYDSFDDFATFIKACSETTRDDFWEGKVIISDTNPDPVRVSEVLHEHGYFRLNGSDHPYVEDNQDEAVLALKYMEKEPSQSIFVPDTFGFRVHEYEPIVLIAAENSVKTDQVYVKGAKILKEVLLKEFDQKGVSPDTEVLCHHPKDPDLPKMQPLKYLLDRPNDQFHDVLNEHHIFKDGGDLLKYLDKKGLTANGDEWTHHVFIPDKDGGWEKKKASVFLHGLGAFRPIAEFSKEQPETPTDELNELKKYLVNESMISEDFQGWTGDGKDSGGTVRIGSPKGGWVSKEWRLFFKHLEEPEPVPQPEPEPVVVLISDDKSEGADSAYVKGAKTQRYAQRV
eukprot:18646_1